MQGPKFNLDTAAFLSRYWQRQPLLIPQAIESFEPPLCADILAGLALEDDIESRIIDTLAGNWQLSHGPFDEADFDRPHPWTLLVQAVDQFMPEVAQLRQWVSFLPHWRIDDVMVSYATDGGSVGPHYDNYDVFLVQGSGQREWRIGQACDEHTPLIDHPDLRLLADFQCQEIYTLKCGDVLYVPPGIAHWGLARGECMTYSIGFRAPQTTDLVSRAVDSYLESASAESFYRDPSTLAATERPGEIRPADIAQARATVLSALSAATSDHWFGELVTEPRYEPDYDPNQVKQEQQRLKDGGSTLALSAAAKLAWQHEGDNLVVYANGQALRTALDALPLLMALCGGATIEHPTLTAALECPVQSVLITQLLEADCLDVF